jgi:uncharacterized protein YndB with AHSA1/START domain
MSTITEPALATQVYSIFIRTTPEKLWEAITTPQFTQQYFYGTRVTVVPDHYESLGPDGSDMIKGDVLEFDPPRKLVHSWSSVWDPEQAAEPPSRLAWEIEPQDGGYCLLTVTHDQLDASPKTATSVSGGWMLVVSGLKTLLETGKPLTSFDG